MTQPRSAARALLAAALLTSIAVVPAAASSLPRTSSGGTPTSLLPQTASGGTPTSLLPRTSSGGTPTSLRSAAAPAPPRSGSPAPAYDRVAHFYGAYIDVAHDPGDNALAAELRTFYLTPRLREELRDWERRHPAADGVLRGRSVPTAWKVTPRDSGMGHTWSVVRLTWGSGPGRTYTYLEVQSDLDTRRISGIRELPTG
ncbi:hypothetical protein GCM10020367_23790 [Streptomyces sannanensis]|uniref:Uncharacterized protein n=1 Tax=Streptomyces sannanensis TaxID=285536 RepID=A0ABP6S9V3_9ACTN